LLLASNLSADLRVGILEKHQIGLTSKFWLTNQSRLQRHALEQCVRFTTNRATVGTFLAPPAVATGDFAVVDEERLLRELMRRCDERGVFFSEQTEAFNFHHADSRLTVETNRGPAQTRLIVDATGGLSQIAASFRLHRIIGFYSIYGAHLENLTLASADIVGAYVLRFGDPPPLFEVIPTSSTSAFVVVFVAARRLHSPASLKRAFEDHVRDNPFFHCRQARPQFTAKFGAIPIGASERRHVPGLLSCGESAMIQSPLLGAAFNEMLDHTTLIANGVNEAFHTTTKGLVNVLVKYPLTKRVNDCLQLMLAKRLTDGSLEDFESLVRFLDRLGPRRAYDLFCTSLRGGHMLTALRLAFVLSRRSRFKAERSDAGPSWLKPPSE